MSYSVKRVFLHVLFPLFAGFLIYYFFRPGVAFVQWFDKREPLLSLNQLNTLQKVVLYSGPDFCWCYSLSSALFIWERWQGQPVKFFSLVVLLFVVGSELVQFIFPAIFTPDWIDVFAAFLAYLLSYWLISKQNYEK